MLVTLLHHARPFKVFILVVKVLKLGEMKA